MISEHVTYLIKYPKLINYEQYENILTEYTDEEYISELINEDIEIILEHVDYLLEN